MVIWKWSLAVTDVQVLKLPKGAVPLTVQMQGGMPQLWALCDEEAIKESRTFHVYGTGHKVPDCRGRYVGTFQLEDGALVFHVFER